MARAGRAAHHSVRALQAARKVARRRAKWERSAACAPPAHVRGKVAAASSTWHYLASCAARLAPSHQLQKPPPLDWQHGRGQRFKLTRSEQRRQLVGSAAHSLRSPRRKWAIFKIRFESETSATPPAWWLTDGQSARSDSKTNPA